MDAPDYTVEEWKPVVGYEGLYEVSSVGRARSVGTRKSRKFPKVLALCHRKNRYQHICLHKDGKQTNADLHVLIAKAFLGLCPEGHQVNHKDGNKLNNAIWNLEWITASGNIRHAIETGLCPKIPMNNKLSELEVREIRKLLDGGEKVNQIARRYGVSSPAISMIKCGKTWANLV